MPNKNKLIIGSRGSQLALWQSNLIKDLLQKQHPTLHIEIEIIKTSGDITQDVALSKIGDKGLFIKELEIALLEKRIDLCVHSMKDVPTTLPDGLCLGPVPKRASACDALVAKKGISSLEDLQPGARIGTGSLRRRAQLFALDKGFELVQLRGNLDTRINKVAEGTLDAVILAAAGIERLGWQEKITSYLSIQQMIPAVGQGALALELRDDDKQTAQLCSFLSHKESEICVFAERKIMKTLEGGCQVPIGAHAYVKEGIFFLTALVASLDGSTLISSEHSGSLEDADEIADKVLLDLIAQGARQILEAVRNDSEDGTPETVLH